MTLRPEIAAMVVARGGALMNFRLRLASDQEQEQPVFLADRFDIGHRAAGFLGRRRRVSGEIADHGLGTRRHRSHQ